MSSVSAWSSRVWATAIAAAPVSWRTRRRNAVALPACRLLEPSPLAAGPGGDVGHGFVEGHLEARAQTAAEGGVLGGVRAEPVIEVGRHHEEAVPAGERHEGVQEGHRVGPAGEPQHDASPAHEGGGGPQRAIDGRHQRG